jgi:hypothetical protein
MRFGLAGVGVRAGRSVAVTFVLAFVASGCGLLAVGGPTGNAGSPAIAMRAADAFLRALVNQQADEAWSHLTKATQHNVYDDNQMAFADDVANADWPGLRWQFGPVTDLDWAWGVHVVVDEERLPTFLVERQIVAGWQGFGIVIHVVTPNDQPYLIAAQGMG